MARDRLLGVVVLFWPLTLATSQSVGQAVAMLAASAGDSTPSDLAPWVQGGGSAAAVAGLVYVAQLIVKGKLVPRQVANYETEITAAIKAAGEREALAMKTVEEYRQLSWEGRAREQSMMKLQGESTELLKEVRAELRYWQDRGTRRG